MITNRRSFSHRWLFLIFATGLCALSGLGEAAESYPISFIDTHAHLNVIARKGRVVSSDYERAAANALSIMSELGIQKSLLMPPPMHPASPRRGEEKFLREIAKRHPQRFSFLGGGGTLNPVIQESVQSARLTTEIQTLFEELAHEIVQSGAVGFGELTAEHFSFRQDHPYESAPPDHPLFLRLADIAARSQMPIDIHMEAISSDMRMPGHVFSQNNPTSLRSNLNAFQRLVAHNRDAVIVWAHAGWDNTGDRTVNLIRGLLQTHPNLYMSVKIDRISLSENRPFAGGKTRPEWIDLIRSFPDRFMIGGDEHFGVSEQTSRGAGRARTARLFLDQLPKDLVPKVASENAIRIYRLQ
jgi:predicted TIM-barrel fold metal-dependent hydrolase